MTTYTLIAYTEGSDGWHDRCGDYNEGTPSELDISYFDNAKECGFMWAYIERQYETTKLLIDGKDPHDDWDNLSQYWDEAKRYCDERSEILKEEHDKKVREEVERKQREEDERKLRLQQDVERRELSQLAALKLKYGEKS